MTKKSKIKLLKQTVPVYDREKAGHGVLRRTTFIMVFCGILLFIPLIWQLFQLMIVQHDEFESDAISNQTRSTTVSADRGVIYDCNMNILKLFPPFSIRFPCVIPENGRKNTAAKQLPSWLHPAVAIYLKVTLPGATKTRVSPRSDSPPIQFTR